MWEKVAHVKKGHLKIHIELEEALADYLQREAVILYSTGFQANLGASTGFDYRSIAYLLDECTQ